MHPRTKFLLGGVVVLGAAGVLMAGAIKDTGIYFLMPAELEAKVAQDPSMIGTGVKVGAKVVPGTVVRDSSGRMVTFEMTDGTATYPVVYRGIIPDTFSDSVEVVVEGRLEVANARLDVGRIVPQVASGAYATRAEYQGIPTERLRGAIVPDLLDLDVQLRLG